MARSNRKKYKFKKGRMVAVLLFFIVIVVGAIYGVSVLGRDGYTSESSFNRYAESSFDQIEGKKQVGESKDEVKYGEPLSQAVQIPVLDKENMNAVVKEDVTKEEKEFQASKSSLPPGGKAALFIGYESYKTPEKVVGVTIHHRVREEDADGNVNLTTKAHPYNFATKSGIPLSSAQIFSGDHASIYNKEAKKQLKKQYGKKMKKGYDKAISSNADHFVMTDKGFKFYYDSDTVLPAEEGVATVEISYDAFRSVMRDDIGERVIDPSKPMVAITYDDGPSEEMTPQLLDIYEKNNSVCTFFELGSNVDNVKSSPQLLKRMLSIGCEIGSHTYSHPNLLTLPPGKVKQEANKTSTAIKNASGKEPTVFRPSYGNGNPNIAKIFDLPSVNWTVDTNDWLTRDKNKIVAHIQSHSNLDGQIILMHSIYQSTVDASAEIVPWLVSKGYQLVTVTELFQYKYGGTPIKGADYGFHPDQPKQ